MRSLSPEENALWARVTASIRPLSRNPEEPEANDRESRSQPPTASSAVRSTKPVSSGNSITRQHSNATLDGSWDKRLQSGRVAPDRIVDLHGMTLDGAWHAIDAELERAIGKGERVLLLVTGHQRTGDPPLVRGRIRAAVYDWLSASRHAPHIAVVRGAHRRHGGGGSLYIILRRPR